MATRTVRCKQRKTYRASSYRRRCAITLTLAEKQAVESVGYVVKLGGLHGELPTGIKEKKYYTPDGKVIMGVPALREYVVRNKEGKVIRGGVRDANLDKGWLETPPSVLQIHCNGCDRWHNTQKEIDICVKSKNKLLKKYEKEGRTKLAKGEQSKDIQISKMENEIKDLKELVGRFMEAKS